MQYPVMSITYVYLQQEFLVALRGGDVIKTRINVWQREHKVVTAIFPAQQASVVP